MALNNISFSEIEKKIRMTIKTDGRIGINTINPENILHINGTQKNKIDYNQSIIEYIHNVITNPNLISNNNNPTSRFVIRPNIIIQNINTSNGTSTLYIGQKIFTTTENLSNFKSIAIQSGNLNSTTKGVLDLQPFSGDINIGAGFKAINSSQSGRLIDNSNINIFGNLSFGYIIFYSNGNINITTSGNNYYIFNPDASNFGINYINETSNTINNSSLTLNTSGSILSNVIGNYIPEVNYDRIIIFSYNKTGASVVLNTYAYILKATATNPSTEKILVDFNISNGSANEKGKLIIYVPAGYKYIIELNKTATGNITFSYNYIIYKYGKFNY